MGMYSLLVGTITFKPGAAMLVENLMEQRMTSHGDISWYDAIAVCPLAQTLPDVQLFAEQNFAERFFSPGGGQINVQRHGEWPEDGPYLRWDLSTGELQLAMTVKDGSGINEFVALLPQLADEWHLVDRYEDWNSRPHWHDFPAVEREPWVNPDQPSGGYGF